MRAPPALSLPLVLTALGLTAAAAETPAQPGLDVIIAGPAPPIAVLLTGEGDPLAAALPPQRTPFDPAATGLPLRPRRLVLDPRPAPPPVAGAEQKGAPPVFLVGADAVSIAWLAAHAAALRRHGAAGLIIQAETAADVRRVRAAAAGLPLIAAPGDALAAALGLQRYPALVVGGRAGGQR